MNARRGSHGLSADAVMQSALFFRTPWLILVTTPAIIWFEVFIFWGERNLDTALWFAVGVIGTAIAWAFQGWEPWNMSFNQVLRGRAMRPDEYSEIQRVTVEFFKTSRLKFLHGMLIAAGAPIPWLVASVSHVFHGQPFRPWLQAIPWWAMTLFGIGEAIRGRAFALFVLARQLKERWPTLLESANAEA